MRRLLLFATSCLLVISTAAVGSLEACSTLTASVSPSRVSRSAYMLTRLAIDHSLASIDVLGVL